jgi:hypothetical protein
VLDLAVDDDGVEALLPAEVLVHDRLRDLRAGGDLLDGGGLEPALREDRAADLDQLGAAGGPRESAERRPGMVDTITTVA